MDQNIENGLSLVAEKSSEFQKAVDAGVQVDLLNRLEQFSGEFIKELRLVASGLLLSPPVVPSGDFFVGNFRLIAEVVKYVEDKERCDVFSIFLDSLCPPERPEEIGGQRTENTAFFSSIKKRFRQTLKKVI